MIKAVIKIGLVVLVALVGFNYFFGTPAEKASSRKIVEGVKDVGKTVGGVIKSEKEKLSEGKMDRVIEDLGNWVERIKGKAQDNPAVKEKAGKLDDMLKLLNEEMKLLKEEKGTESKERRALRKKMRKVEDEIQKLADEVGLSFDGESK